MIKIRPKNSFQLKAILKFGIVLSTTFLFSGCFVSDTEYQAVLEIQKSQEIELQSLREKARLSNSRADLLEKNLALKTSQLEEQEKALQNFKDLQNELENLKKEQEKAKQDFEAYRKKYRSDARAKAAGEKLDTLLTRDGKAYSSVTIRAVVPDGIHIMHDSGATKILFAQLEPSWSERFDFDPNEAEVYTHDLAKIKSDALAVQQAELSALQRQQKQEQAFLEKVSAQKRSKEDNAERKRLNETLYVLRIRLIQEFQRVRNSGVKGIDNWSSWSRISAPYNANDQYDFGQPENADCLEAYTTKMSLTTARTIRDQIVEVKRQLGQ